jgi:hypothetical protein
MEGRLTIRNTMILGVVLAALAVGLYYLLYGLGGSEVQAQEDCREVLSLGPETENQLTEPFDIEGNSFRVSGDLRNTDPEESLQSLTIRPIDQDTELAADTILIQDVGAFEETVLEGPGTFALEIEMGVSGSEEYTVQVEDCGATPRGGPGEPKGGSTNPSISPGPKTPASPPKTSSPAPKTPPSAPKTPTPAPKESGSLMKAGGPSEGPMPPMPGGGCPQEFPTMRDGACYSA